MTIIIKNEEEINTMRQGGQILGKLLEALINKANPGTCVYDLDQFAEKFIKDHSALPSFKGYQGFPGTICTAINSGIVHGIPKKEDILKKGDLFTIDCGVYFEGLHTDAARSCIVGGKGPNNRHELLKTAEKALNAATAVAISGNRVSDISKAIQSIVENKGYHVIRDLTGHGVGKKLHEAPIINNYFDGNEGAKLTPGMTLAIEPIFAVGTDKMITQKDNWTLVTADDSDAIQVENTILITKTGNETLTKA
ncbi:type I methionyl aminopeptidase [Candidatus Peregrinibacteria bacterium]|nr:type I methionyl aminopeptidase [Candidatus Peregrinibacteria bacterium]